MGVTEGNGSFDFAEVAKRVADCQAKLLEIAKANTELSVGYATAIAKVQSPSDFMSVTSEFAKKRMELFQQSTKELLEFGKL